MEQKDLTYNGASITLTKENPITDDSVTRERRAKTRITRWEVIALKE